MAPLEIDAAGMAVAPGFINMLSWADESLIADGRGQSDIRQGVTLEVFGEGGSMGPMNDAMKKENVEAQGDIKYAIEWTTLGEYLEYLERRGVSPNVASFVGATTVRIHELGQVDRAPTAAELARMQALVREAMEDGALGVGSSLIYAPAFYAKTDELDRAHAGRRAVRRHVHLAHAERRQPAARGDRRARDDRPRIEGAGRDLPPEGRRQGELAEARPPRWPRSRRRAPEGLRITANMYTYPAGATGLDASMPPWVQEGGYNAWAARLKDPAIRRRVAAEMTTPTNAWENFFTAVEGPEQILLVAFKNDALKPLTGKTLAEVARMRGKPPEETAMDLVIEDGSRVGTVYFLMSEENVRRQMALPWVSFGSDAEAPAPEGVFLKSNPHPRAYGTFARVLGRYVRDEKALIARRRRSGGCPDFRPRI